MRLGALPLAVLAASMLAGCGRTSGEAPASPVRPGLHWEHADGPGGTGLVLYDARDRSLLRISCLANPPRMSVAADTLTPVGSAEELSMGVDDEAFMFVADPTATDVPGVHAEAGIPPDLLSRLEHPREVGVVYGAQQLGPYIPPEPGMARSFAEACRRIAGLPAAPPRPGK